MLLVNISYAKEQSRFSNFFSNSKSKTVNKQVESVANKDTNKTINKVANNSLEKDLEYAQSLSNVFEHVAKSITPSIVNIKSTRKIEKSSRQTLMIDPRMRHFFDFFEKDFFDDLNEQTVPEIQQGSGTGVIIDEKGHIVTNNHVIDKADKVEVKLSNKETYTAKVVGKDLNSDIAVLKIDAKNLVPAKLGDSDNVKIGEWVLAGGNPFGLDNTITTGIVSARGRSFSSGTRYEDYIQTDAAINPGNSGGPLVNLRSEVIGINTAIFSKNGGYMGIGFAIPSNMVKKYSR
ncbi:MAG: S1C family serine protease [Bdellovibrionota bacterium]